MSDSFDRAGSAPNSALRACSFGPSPQALRSVSAPREIQTPLNTGQRRTVASISPPPHAARFWWDIHRPELAIVTEPAADFTLG
jgi:hypothetical protein